MPGSQRIGFSYVVTPFSAVMFPWAGVYRLARSAEDSRVRLAVAFEVVRTQRHPTGPYRLRQMFLPTLSKVR